MDTGAQAGIRETRRIKGKYMLSREDVLQAQRFDDSVARFSFFLDIHNPAGSSSELHQRLYIKGGSFFEIPYQCLVPSVVTNLLVSGRCISADHQANGTVRVIPACFATGQAAGTPAVLSIQNNKMPEAIDVKQLQKILRQDGCVS